MSIKTKSSPNDRQGLRGLRSEGTEHRFDLKCVVDCTENDSTECDGIIHKYTSAINLESFCLLLTPNLIVIIFVN